MRSNFILGLMRRFGVHAGMGWASEEHAGPAVEAPGRTVTREEINQLPLRRYKGPVELVGDDEGVKRAVKRLRRERVLGFDTESRPAFRKGESYLPSVVQLAADDMVYVFQLPGIGDKKPLFSLFSTDRVLKAGVALSYDIRKLQELFPFEPAGFVELEALTDQAGILNNGLRSLTAAVLGFRISKGAQRSNWSRQPLTENQISYAATDAWVSREIYLALQGRKATGG